MRNFKYDQLLPSHTGRATCCPKSGRALSGVRGVFPKLTAKEDGAIKVRKTDSTHGVSIIYRVEGRDGSASAAAVRARAGLD